MLSLKNKKLKKKVKRSFKKLFKAKPLLVYSPGRINLIGEHTDYNEGFAFPAAINKGIALAIQKSESKSCRVYALNKNEVLDFSIFDIQPIVDGGWRNYILGVVSEIIKLGLKPGNFNAVFAGNIPEGAGMSSSAALENSFVFGLNEIFKLGLSRYEMIWISQKAEHNFAGVKCGIMDQYASMFGEERSALFLDCRTVESEPFKIDFENYKLILINSNVKHDLSESVYNERRSVCETVSEKLDVKALRDATKINLDRIKLEITNEDFEKALYVIEENERVKSFSEAIKDGDLIMLGQLLYGSHEGLRDQYKVSCSELDFLVDRAKENPYVLGARMMGGGFGGCTINLVLKNSAKKFEKEISDSYLKEFGKACTFHRLKLSAGTRVIK